jgi:hypothetical protein
VVVSAASMSARSLVALPESLSLTSSVAYPSAPGVVAVSNQASVTLAWTHSPDSAVIGYRLYWWSEDKATGGKMADVGYRTRATIQDLPEGVELTFHAAAYDTNGIESALSNPVTARTQTFIRLYQDRWSVISFGLYGQTNVMQSSSNLIDWHPMLEWIGDGTAKRLLHTNAGQAYFRVIQR